MRIEEHLHAAMVTETCRSGVVPVVELNGQGDTVSAPWPGPIPVEGERT